MNSSFHSIIVVSSAIYIYIYNIDVDHLNAGRI